MTFGDLKQVGQVQVAIFADEAAWKSTTKAFRSATLTVAAGAAEAVFEQLPLGRYGVMAYHDRNANKKLDTLPIGLPTEPYGFSNDARGTFGLPAWRKAEVVIAPGATVVQAIRLK